MVGDRWQFYVDRFAREYADGTDLEGEARFVDALAARSAGVLDGGCGTGRTSGALHRMGHRVVGVDRDAGLIEVARSRYPGPRFEVCDLLAIGAALPDLLFDVIVLAGNVMVYLAPGTEARVVRTLAGALAPGGRLVTGFATDREYALGAFDADCAAAGLVLEQRFGTWHLDPWRPDMDWAVTVLRRPAAGSAD